MLTKELVEDKMVVSVLKTRGQKKSSVGLNRKVAELKMWGLHRKLPSFTQPSKRAI